MCTLEEQLISACTTEQLKEEFFKYKKSKTDPLNPRKINVPMGVDGVSWKAFERDLDHQVYAISERVRNGSYFFSPFREVVIPKDSQGERTISIASIRDALIQRKIYRVLIPFSEQLFRQLPVVSFAYRPGHSVSQAVHKLSQYINDGYTYVFDADIKSFFDEIPHPLLIQRLESLFQKDSPLIFSLLRRFVSTDRVEWKTYEGNLKIFYKQKPKRTPRKKGIPQGGILSGLLTNLYLHPFDEWIIKNLGKDIDLKYIRYADDFVVLTRSKEDVLIVKSEVERKLLEFGLQLHKDGQKTKCIDTTYQSVEFLGFDVSPTGIRIKKHNIKKFKKRILAILQQMDFSENMSKEEVKKVICRVQYKIFGNEAFGIRVCRICKKPEARRSWLQFFLSLTDVQQLRGLDYWIRKKIHYYYYKKTEERLKRCELKEMNIKSLESLYYSFRKEFKRRKTCTCPETHADYRREPILNFLFKRY